MKIRLVADWRDFWIGAYWNKHRRRLYVLPFPMLGFYVEFGSARWEPQANDADRVALFMEAARREGYGGNFEDAAQAVLLGAHIYRKQEPAVMRCVRVVRESCSFIEAALDAIETKPCAGTAAVQHNCGLARKTCEFIRATVDALETRIYLGVKYHP